MKEARSTSRPSPSRVHRGCETFLEQINGATVYSSLTSSENLQRSKLQRILHTIEIERIIITLRIIIAFRNGTPLSLANNFSLSLSSGREWKGRRKNPSQEGEEEHRFNSESFSRECSPDKNLPPSINLLVFLTLENVNETLSTFNNPAAAGSALFFHRPV